MSRRKLSPKDFAALNRATVGVRYPAGGGPAELRALARVRA